MIATAIAYTITGIFLFFGGFYFCTLPFGGLNKEDNTERGLRFVVCVGLLFAAYLMAWLGGI